MNRKKIASVAAAFALPIAALQVAGAGAATAAPAPGQGSCGTWVSGPGQTGNVTCPSGGTRQFRAKVTCVTSRGSTFTVYGEWLYQGVSEATCSLNDAAGVLYIDWERRNKG
ncbi:hypothetical protein [Streptomyces sp. NBC_01546]|uniref:hypothetical protein n=1 Tax=Streptomyces sp. NBC_01546 TaxID=2975872 RepID=UPI00386FBA6C